jgi:hypothetical protein
MDPLVMIALSHCIKHMRDFGLSAAFSNPSLFQSFHNRNSMLLNGKTLENLYVSVALGKPSTYTSGVRFSEATRTTPTEEASSG